MGICSEAKIHEIERSEVKEEYKLVIGLFKTKKRNHFLKTRVVICFAIYIMSERLLFFLVEKDSFLEKLK